MVYIGKRPGTVTAVAVILFIVGGWSLLMGTCGGGMAAVLALKPQAVEGPPGKVDPADAAAVQRFLANEVPGYTIVVFSLTGIDIILGLGQIVSGIGLLRMSGVARLMAILLTLIKLFFSFAGHAYSVILVVPAQVRMMQMNPLPQPVPFDVGRFTEAITWLGVFITVVIQLAIVITIISLLCTKRVRDAFAGSTPPVVDEEDRFRRRAQGYGDDPRAPPETGIREES
jgi:hypothetical protein